MPVAILALEGSSVSHMGTECDLVFVQHKWNVNVRWDFNLQQKLYLSFFLHNCQQMLLCD